MGHHTVRDLNIGWLLRHSSEYADNTFMHFLLAHGPELSKLASKYSDDFHEDIIVINDIYNAGVTIWAEWWKESQVGINDVVRDKEFLWDAVAEYERVMNRIG